LAQRIWRSLRLVAAGLVLFTIAADLVADTRCHGASRASAEVSVSADSSAARQDPCAAGCVPDCFCCSTLSTSPGVPPVDVSGPAALVAVLAVPDFQPGVLPLPYRPPLALSLS